MSAYKPPADASVIDDSGLVSVYRLADGHILFVDETSGESVRSDWRTSDWIIVLSIFVLITIAFSVAYEEVSAEVPLLAFIMRVSGLINGFNVVVMFLIVGVGNTNSRVS